MLEVAEPLGAKQLQVAASAILGSAGITSGTIPEACAHFQRARDLASTAEFPSPVAAYDIDVHSILSSVHAIALVLAGQPEAGREMMAQSLVRARKVDHVYSLASALSSAATTCYFLDDFEAAGRFAQECLQFLDGLGFHQPESLALVFGGWSRVCRGDADGIGDIERAVEVATSTGALGGIAQLHITAAETFGRVRDFSRAHHFLRLAERVIDRTGERTAFEPQLPMFRANLILDSKGGSLDEAEELVRESLDRWAVYRSPWMELRSAILLGRIALERGEAGDARDRLERLLGMIAVGSETARVRLARALIERLR
jgi:adenylate cyclase